MKPGDLFIVTRVPKRAERLVRRGDGVVLLEESEVPELNTDCKLVLVRIRQLPFLWALEDLLRISL